MHTNAPQARQIMAAMRMIATMIVAHVLASSSSLSSGKNKKKKVYRAVISRCPRRGEERSHVISKNYKPQNLCTVTGARGIFVRLRLSYHSSSSSMWDFLCSSFVPRMLSSLRISLNSVTIKYMHFSPS